MIGDEEFSGPAGQVDLVTVVVPALDEERSIGRCLESVLRQSHDRLQVLVVDGGSRDRTTAVVAEYARRDARVALLDNPQRRAPYALNHGLCAARGRWFVRVDAHSTISPDYVGRAVAHLRSGRWGGVGGRKDGVGRTTVGRAVAGALGSPFGVGGSVYHFGTEVQEVDHVPYGAYPTALARELGGWNERLEANEDYEFDDRLRSAGHRLLFDPALRIEWQVAGSLPVFFSQYRRYGRGKAAVVLLRPRSVQPRHLAAPALVLALAVLAPAAARRPLRLWLLAPYAGVVALGSVLTAPRVDRSARRWLPLTFVTMHVGWGLGFFEGLVLSGWTLRQRSRVRQCTSCT